MRKKIWLQEEEEELAVEVDFNFILMEMDISKYLANVIYVCDDELDDIERVGELQEGLTSSFCAKHKYV